MRIENFGLMNSNYVKFGAKFLSGEKSHSRVLKRLLCCIYLSSLIPKISNLFSQLNIQLGCD
jgi:hypothetical protein